MSIDWDKPVQTRDGREVRIYTTEGMDADYPVVGAYAISKGQPANGSVLASWKIDGTIDSIHEMPHRALINVVPQQYTVWVNVYKSHNSLALLHYDTRDIADKLVQEGRIACIEVTFTEGGGL